MNHVIHECAIKHITLNISFSADLYISPRHLPIKLLPNRPPLCTSKASCHRPSAAQPFKATMPARSLSSTLPWNRLSCCFSFKICVWHFDVVLWWWLVYFLYPFIDGFLFSLSLCVSACLQSHVERMFHVLVHPYNLHLDKLSIFFAWLLWSVSTFDFANSGSKSSKDWPFKAKAPESRSSWQTSSWEVLAQKLLPKTSPSENFHHFSTSPKRSTDLAKRNHPIEQQHVWIRNNQPFHALSTAPGRFPGPRRDVRALSRPPSPPRPRWEAPGRAGRYRRGQPWRRCGSRWWWNLGGWDLDGGWEILRCYMMLPCHG